MKVRYFLAIAAGGLFLDQLTKLLAFTLFSDPGSGGHGPSLIPGLLHATLRVNYGISWSLLQWVPPWLLVVGNLVIVGLLGYFYSLSAHSRVTLWADASLAAVVGGALGNIVDRIHAGGVLDFIDIYVPSIGFDYPVFNVADVLIVAGVVVYIALSWRMGDERSAAKIEASR